MAKIGVVKASPLATRYAALMGVELSAITGTGYAGKIRKSDVQHWLDRKLARRDDVPASSVSISAIVNTMAASTYLDRVNHRFPGTEITLADIAGRALAAAVPAEICAEVDEFFVCVEALKQQRCIPADGRNRKLRDIANDCTVSYEQIKQPDYGMLSDELAAFPSIDFSVTDISKKRSISITLKGKWDKDGVMRMTMTLMLRPGDEGAVARLLEKTVQLIEEPVLLML